MEDDDVNDDDDDDCMGRTATHVCRWLPTATVPDGIPPAVSVSCFSNKAKRFAAKIVSEMTIPVVGN